MKIKNIILTMLLVLCTLFSLATVAYANSYTGDNVFPGLSDIMSGDSLTLPKNTIWATLSANWGVKVIFVDWDEVVLKEEIVPVSDTTPGSSSAPSDPTRSGFIFTGWERYDTNGDVNVTLHDDGSVTSVTGPGPVVYIATYIRRVGNLSISMSNASSNKAFDFTITLEDTSINGTYGDVTFNNGVAVFSLKNGESITVTNIPAGTYYSVSQNDNKGYNIHASGDAGVIAEGETTIAAFIYSKKNIPNTSVVQLDANAIPYYNMHIAK